MLGQAFAAPVIDPGVDGGTVGVNTTSVEALAATPFTVNRRVAVAEAMGLVNMAV